jgi:hypothetical protein
MGAVRVQEKSGFAGRFMVNKKKGAASFTLFFGLQQTSQIIQSFLDFGFKRLDPADNKFRLRSAHVSPAGSF